MMNELQIIVPDALVQISSPLQIVSNIEGFRGDVKALMESIKGRDFDDEEAKKVKAQLNKAADNVSAARIAFHKECLKPVDAIMADLKAIEADIAEASSVLKKQTDSCNQRRKDAKAEEIAVLFRNGLRARKVAEPEGYWLNLDAVIKPEWLNASKSLAAVAKEIDDALEKIFSDYDAIKLIDEEYRGIAIHSYMSSLSLPEAMKTVENFKQQLEYAKNKNEHPPQVQTEIGEESDDDDVSGRIEIGKAVLNVYGKRGELRVWLKSILQQAKSNGIHIERESNP